MAGYGFYNYGNATANTPASAVGDTLVSAFNKANRNNTNMRFPNQWGSSALLGADGKPYQSKWAFNDPLQQGVVAPTNTSTAMFQHGMMKGVPQVDPLQLQQFFKGQSQEAVGKLGTVLPNFDSSFVRNAPSIGPDNIPYLGSRMDNAPLEGYPYRGEFYNEDTFTQGGQPTGVPSAPQVPSKVPAAVVAPSQYSQPAARTSAVSSVGQPASNVQVQPTQSGQISPIGLQGVTRAMDAPATYVPEGQQVNPSWLQSTTDKLGEFLGIQNGTQYLKNSDGSLMVDASGNNIVDTSGRTWGDIGAGVKGAADIGMGLYGMFTRMDQNQHALDTQRGQLNLMREKYAEDKRKNQAIVAQNRGA